MQILVVNLQKYTHRGSNKQDRLSLSMIFFDSSKRLLKAGHSIFAHSRSDKVGTPPDQIGIYFQIIHSDYRQKNPLKHYVLPLQIICSCTRRNTLPLSGFAVAKRTVPNPESSSGLMSLKSILLILCYVHSVNYFKIERDGC